MSQSENTHETNRMTMIEMRTFIDRGGRSQRIAAYPIRGVSGASIDEGLGSGCSTQVHDGSDNRRVACAMPESRPKFDSWTETEIFFV